MPIQTSVRLATISAILVSSGLVQRLSADPPGSAGIVRISDGAIQTPVADPQYGYPQAVPAYAGHPYYSPHTAELHYQTNFSGYPSWRPQKGLPRGVRKERSLRNARLLAQMIATFPHRKVYEWMGGPPVGKGGPVDIMLSHDGRRTYPPDYGWSRPVKQPIYRVPVSYSNYWPEHWYGTPHKPTAQQPRTYPVIGMPTDTTQLGYYAQRVPQWLPNPGMLPPDPYPPQYVAREAPFLVEPTVYPMSPLQYHYRILKHNWYGHPWPQGYPHGPAITTDGMLAQDVDGTFSGENVPEARPMPLDSDGSDDRNEPDATDPPRQPRPIEASNRSIYSPSQLR